MADGFRPGNISSDLHLYNVEGPVFDQVTTISKFMWLGMSLYDVIALTTAETAKTMGVQERLGTLNVGAVGDATITRVDEGSFKAHRLVRTLGHVSPQADSRSDRQERTNLQTLAPWHIDTT